MTAKEMEETGSKILPTWRASIGRWIGKGSCDAAFASWDADAWHEAAEQEREPTYAEYAASKSACYIAMVAIGDLMSASREFGTEGVDRLAVVK